MHGSHPGRLMASRLVTARLADGVALPFVERGPVRGIAVVFLHGFSDHWRSFAPVLPRLRGDLRAFALTLRGHGGASQPEAGYAIADLADDVLGFLDTQQLDRVVLTGHSLGSAVALELALRAPERVAGLILAPGFASLTGPAIEELRAAVHGLSDPIDERFVAMVQEQAREPHLPPGLFAAMVEHSLAMPARVWRAVIDAVCDFDVEGELSRVKAPALLIWGARDAFVSRAAQDTLLEGLPRAELVVYRNGSHTPHWDEPVRYAAEVGRFASRALGG